MNIDTNTAPNVTVQHYYPRPPVPNVCPGCGRCRDCGQPAPAPRPWPWPWYPTYPTYQVWC